MDEGLYRIRVLASPEKGKANAELTKILAKYFGISKDDVIITRGRKSKLKEVSIHLPESE